jgi:hypothetical protein
MQPLSQPSIPRKLQSVQDQVTALAVRIGVISAFNTTSGGWTVTIGGVDTLFTPACLSSYTPTLGDTVVILKYDTQWIVLGAIS